MATFTNDTFTGTDGTTLTAHAGEAGATWTKHPNSGPGTFSLATNRARPASTSYALYYASGAPASADYDVDATLRCVSNDGFTQVCGRLSTTATTFYQATFDSAGTGGAGFFLYKTVAGVDTELGRENVTPAAGTDYVVKLSMVGTAIKAYRGGVLKVSATDSSVTAAGRAGLGGSTYAAPGTGVGFHADVLTGTDAGGGGGATPTYVSQLLTLGVG